LVIHKLSNASLMRDQTYSVLREIPSPFFYPLRRAVVACEQVLMPDTSTQPKEPPRDDAEPPRRAAWLPCCVTALLDAASGPEEAAKRRRGK